MIVRIKNHLHSNYKLYTCAVYSLSCNEERIKNTQMLEPENLGLMQV